MEAHPQEEAEGFRPLRALARCSSIHPLVSLRRWYLPVGPPAGLPCRLAGPFPLEADRRVLVGLQVLLELRVLLEPSPVELGALEREPYWE